ncbi:MAG: NAD-dependent epimerase/dehydratase family protein [Fibrobacter sp.]|nr:NAD-dependent epimerase/dehydratase family protein [Fibrobacter sp.]
MSKELKHTVITGGAGFIGTNLAHRLLKTGETVTIIDNLSRSGVKQNLEWLQKNSYSNNLRIKIADIRDRDALVPVLNSASSVFHLAAQVAVTSSLLDPMEDFDVNLKGTLTLLEVLRSMKEPPFLLFTSTNKVYGNLGNIQLKENSTRFTPVDSSLDTGINESHSLDFHSPYGCSKGGADQYILDYARTYNLPATVFRMSCIYGPHQFGNEDQGWVAHFIFRVIQNQKIIIFGNGKQVRDLLFIDDLIDAFLCARENKSLCAGRAFTIGGGRQCAVSILELLEYLKSINGSIPSLHFDSWRTGDQLYYVSDTTSFRNLTGWNNKVPVQDGIQKLYYWVQNHIKSNSINTIGAIVQ